MVAVVSVNTREIKQLAEDVKKLTRAAYPIAVERTLNDGVKSARVFARENIKNKMINRNAYTRNSVRFILAKRGPVSSKFSIVGSIARYMDGQEFGKTVGKKQSKGGESGVPIPTSFSAGQHEKSIPRLKLPRAGNKFKRILLNRKKRAGANRKQVLMLSVNKAVATGRRYFFYDFGGSKARGIFKAVGGTKSGAKKSGWPQGTRIRLIWSMRQRSYTVPKNPWLLPAVEKTELLMPGFYVDQLNTQIARNKLFK